MFWRAFRYHGLSGPETEGEEVPVGEENGEDATGDGDEKAVNADGGMDFAARDRHGEVEAEGRENGEGDRAEEEEKRPQAEGAERVQRFSSAEERNDEGKYSDQGNNADAKMLYV